MFPLWSLETRALAERFIADGCEAVAVCVDTQQIAGTFAGRSVDKQFVSDLIAGEQILRDARFLYCDLPPAALCSRALELRRLNHSH